jgi:RimJ/RimL family protein N-acetyltransferase
VALTLVPYGAEDLPLLRAANAPEMTAFLGGPESADALERRHAKYQRPAAEGEARMFRIVAEEHPAIGIIGWWHSEWHDQAVQEAGWSVLPEHQGKGYATEALRALLRDAADHGDRALLVANPRIDNPGSNAVCARAGMSFQGEEDDEYPPGNRIRTNVWTFDLAALREARALGYLP